MPGDSSSPFCTKQQTLSENESRLSLTAWMETLTFHISNDTKFARFNDDLSEWGQSSEPHRGFTSDETDANGSKLSAAQKSINLKMLLGFIAIHAPVISSSFIKDDATSLEEIFQRLREYYDCRKSGSKITELLDFRLGNMESREALWERVYSFIEDNLLTKSSGVMHKGKAVPKDETLTPTLQNIAVIIWLDAIHRGLPSLVKQRFAIPLRNTSIYSIRTEISDAVPSLLQELGERDGTISYTGSYFKERRGKHDKYGGGRQKSRPKCCLCEAASRSGSDTHYFQSCPFLPPADRKYLKSKIGDIEVLPDTDDEHSADSDEECYKSNSKSVKVKPAKKSQNSSKINRVDIVSSPVMTAEVDDEDAEITLDSGAESNLIKKSVACHLKVKIYRTSHRANMADGETPMDVEGKSISHCHVNAQSLRSITISSLMVSL